MITPVQPKSVKFPQVSEDKPAVASLSPVRSEMSVAPTTPYGNHFYKLVSQNLSQISPVVCWDKHCTKKGHGFWDLPGISAWKESPATAFRSWNPPAADPKWEVREYRYSSRAEGYATEREGWTQEETDQNTFFAAVQCSSCSKVEEAARRRTMSLYLVLLERFPQIAGELKKTNNNSDDFEHPGERAKRRSEAGSGRKGLIVL